MKTFSIHHFLLFHFLSSNFCDSLICSSSESVDYSYSTASSSTTIKLQSIIICFLAPLLHEVAFADITSNISITKVNEHLSDLILLDIYLTFVVADHSLLKFPSLVSMTMEAPSFLFQVLRDPSNSSLRFLFLCLYFGSGCSPRILIFAVFLSIHLWELSFSLFLSLSHFHTWKISWL